jgi:polyketide-type polyunsaturated fatty acid synthase PfaA
MFAPMADGTFVQLEDEVDKLEKDLVRLIKQKKMTSERIAQNTQTEINRKLQKTPIAIIGMASIFPEAKNLQEYWDKIIKKVDCITDVPLSRWNPDDYYDPDPKAPDKTYCKRGGFIPDVDFNPIEFGLPPNLLEVTDISQLLSLVVAKETMEDAGYGSDRNFSREKIGVILGAAIARQLTEPYGARLQYPIWKKVLKNSGLSDEDTEKIIEKIQLAYVNWEENSFPGMLANVIAGRIANRLNLGATNCTIDAACASSLAALKMAISELLNGHADMMLTGGVDTDNSIFAYLCFSKTPALSKSQQTRPFDVDADGMMLGEGIGMMMLKRLKDAEKDGDKIYAVIKGIGTSSDGRYKSIYAPRSEGQMKALSRAYEEAGFEPTSIGLMEAHGTGTMAGDPAEFAALKEVFGNNSDSVARIALGSVKSQIGHTKAAAGAAGLIKTALALHHKVLPATINITKPNPKLDIENTPFYLNIETRPWIKPKDSIPRRAGVSSFGFGGTNYHVVLEEYVGKQDCTYRLHNTPQSIVLFAETSDRLLNRCQDVLIQLQSDSCERHYQELVDSCASQKIPLSSARVGFVVSSINEARDRLQTTIKLLKIQKGSSWEHPHGIYYRQAGMQLKGKVVALFSGQGSQYLEMGRELAVNFPEIRQAYAEMDGLMAKDELPSISDRVFPIPSFEPKQQKAQANALQSTDCAQPAIGVFSYSLYKIMQQAGFTADFVAGHSFGELTALWAAKVLSDEDYFFLIKARGQAMATPNGSNSETGTMMAVKGDVSKIASAIASYREITIANFNSPQQAVLAGSKAAIAKVEKVLTARGYSPVLLSVAAAFHTPLVAHAQKPFAKAVEAVTFRRPQIPVYTNVTGNPYPSDLELMKKNLKDHLLNRVLFQQEIENLYDRGGYCFVEFGPRSILTNLVKEILADRPHIAIALNGSRQKDSDLQLREAVVQLRVAGLSLQNLDPYQLQTKRSATKLKKGFSFQLNGNNYISEKTKEAFEKALQDGHQVRVANLPKVAAKETTIAVKEKKTASKKPAITLEQNVAASKAPEIETKKNVAVAKDKASELVIRTPQVFSLTNTRTTTTTLKPIVIESRSKSPMNYQRALKSLEDSITQFSQHQKETLQLHGQYLSHQMESAKIFLHLMQQQNQLLANCPTSDREFQATEAVLNSVDNSMVKFHQHQAETLKVHEQSLEHQSEYARNLFQLTQQKFNLLLEREPSFDRSSELPAIIEDENNDREFSFTLPIEKSFTNGNRGTNGNGNSIYNNGNGHHSNGSTAIVDDLKPQQKLYFPAKPAEKTEPLVSKETASPTKNSGIENQSTSLKSTPSIPPIEFKPAPAIEREIKPIQPPVPIQVRSQPIPEVSTPSSEITPSNLNDAVVNSQEIERSIELLLQIVSDKTGYPVEMLELDMDMEADLGIDSIKRVEILSAMQEQFSDAPQANPEELGEMRTLGQIVGLIQGLSVKNDVEISEVPAFIPQTIENAPPVESSQPQQIIAEETIEETAIDLDGVSQTLLEVIGDKTGYPVEMLELDMDMEADLGIDSIKRVEILGAMQEQFPEANVTQANPEELAELRTLGQIISYMQQQAPEKKNLATSM